MQISDARSLIQRHEGCSLVARPDAKGKWAYGYGHDISAPAEGQAAPTCTQAEADVMLDADLAVAEAGACRVLGEGSWDALNAARQAALIDMAYEMGAAGLAGFKVTLSLIRLEDYDAASAEMLLSAWAKEVQRRAWEDALIIRTGEFPASA